MIAMRYDEPVVPRLYGAEDLPWIGQLLGVVEQAGDASWRQLAARVEHGPIDAAPAHRTAMFQAVRQIVMERERPPVLDRWPDVEEVAGVANLARLERWVRRAHGLQVRVWARGYELARQAARLGVVAELRRDLGTGGLVLDAIGPLAMPQAVLAYGRALAALIPELCGHDRVALDLHAQLAGAEVRLRLAPPILLSRREPPPGSISPSSLPRPAEDACDLPDGMPDARGERAVDRLAAELGALGYRVEREPGPIEVGGHVLLPELAIGHAGRTSHVEVLAFSTRAHLQAKLARYRAARADVVLCVDRTYARDCDVDLPVCGFYRHVELDELFAQLASQGHRASD